MPYFKWSGVDIMGACRKGKSFARTDKHLDAVLLKRGVALLRVQPVRFWIVRPINLAHIVHVFRQLTTLLDAGILLPEALDLVAEQIDHPQLQDIMHKLADVVHEGIPLSEAMHEYPLFNTMMVQHIRVGEESGNLALAFDALSNSIEMTHDFYSKLRAVLLLPIITLGFFVLIAAVIFTVIIPRFADLFAASHQDIPLFTRVLLQISSLLCSWYGLYLLSFMMMVGIAIYWYVAYRSGKQKLLTLGARMPLLSTIIRYRFLANFTYSLAMLLKSGMRLVPALRVMRQAREGQLFYEHLDYVEESVDSGSSLSDALAQCPGAIFGQDTIAMIAVGEESGQLPAMLARIAHSYHERVKRRLDLSTTMLQPLFMLLLGLLVTGLIFAVYGPIFNLANVAGF